MKKLFSAVVITIVMLCLVSCGGNIPKFASKHNSERSCGTNVEVGESEANQRTNLVIVFRTALVCYGSFGTHVWVLTEDGKSFDIGNDTGREKYLQPGDTLVFSDDNELRDIKWKKEEL